ncbi:MAG: hypothetical protein AB7I33_12180 [Gemmatimonadales bacterium]
MTRVLLRPLLAFALISVSMAPAQPAAAQLTLGLRAGTATPYVWRGITRANGLILQPEGYLAVRYHQTVLSAGVWGAYETGSRSPGNLSDLGSDRPGFSELNYWTQATHRFRGLDVFAGVIRYDYRGRGPLAVKPSGASTTEVYGGLQKLTPYIVPKLTVYGDIDAVKGTYLEGSVTLPLLAVPVGNPIVFYFTALMGYNLGQERNAGDPSQRATFASEGFTHSDLSLSGSFVLSRRLGATLTLTPHLQFKIDDATRRTSPEPGDLRRNQQFWLAASFAVSPVIAGWNGR